MTRTAILTGRTIEAAKQAVSLRSLSIRRMPLSLVETRDLDQCAASFRWLARGR
jgi:hypothetical protein